MKRYIMALDQGTTSSRAIIFDHNANIVAMAQREFEQIYPQPGWVEHDPMEIYATQYGAMIEVLARSGISAREIAGIGITNQRETTVVWDKSTGKPVYHAIVWQCRRTADLCEAFEENGHAEWLRKKTGLIPDAYFSATKIQWILNHVPGAKEQAKRGELLFGTVDSWLIWKLSGGKVHKTDVTNASRTMLFNIHTLQWDKEICEMMDIPMQMLPEVCDSSCFYTNILFDGVEIPIAGAAGDQQAALFGQGCTQSGEVKNTYGTGCFMLMNTGDTPIESKNGLLTTIACGMKGQVTYALEGSVFVAGAVVQWMRDELKLIERSEESEQLAQSVPDTNGAYIVPAFTGLGAPYWDMYARGTITGLTRGVNRCHLVRAALESIAYQTLDVLTAMRIESGQCVTELKVDGGACANTFLMQFQADCAQIHVRRPLQLETTAKGAAYLAGLAVGFWKDLDEIKQIQLEEDFFVPKISPMQAQQLVRGWHQAVKRSMGNFTDER